jgi:hypothetical protein
MAPPGVRNHRATSPDRYRVAAPPWTSVLPPSSWGPYRCASSLGAPLIIRSILTSPVRANRHTSRADRARKTTFRTVVYVQRHLRLHHLAGRVSGHEGGGCKVHLSSHILLPSVVGGSRKEADCRRIPCERLVGEGIDLKDPHPNFAAPSRASSGHPAAMLRAAREAEEKWATRSNP